MEYRFEYLVDAVGAGGREMMAIGIKNVIVTQDGAPLLVAHNLVRKNQFGAVFRRHLNQGRNDEGLPLQEFFVCRRNPPISTRILLHRKRFRNGPTYFGRGTNNDDLLARFGQSGKGPP